METQQYVNLVTAFVFVIVFLVMIFTGVISAGFVLVLRHNKEYLKMAYEGADPRTQSLLATSAGALKKGADTLEDLANLGQEITGGNAQSTSSSKLPPSQADIARANLDLLAQSMFPPPVVDPGAIGKPLPVPPATNQPGG